ncbi:MAG: response regulator [Phycisphaerales bacterium]|nr:MAG: response regulator [Phycisphaerales bacterium]
MGSDPSTVPWPMEGDALIVDDELVVCRTYAGHLEKAGCTCHAAQSYNEALSVLDSQRRVTLVITDHGLHGDDTEQFVTTLRARRPGVVVVGSSGKDCREDLARFGVDRFLHKPWRIEQLVDLLSARIGTCASCNTPLPLRRAFPDEVGESWVCAFCGARYKAMLDKDSPAAILRNARRPQPV